MATLTTSYQKIAEGTSKKFGGAYGRVDLYAKYNSQSIENNTSSVTWKLSLVVWNGYIGDYNNNKPVTITGTTGSQTTYIGSKNYYSQDLATYTETITHSSDGTKTATASGSVNFTAWGQSLSVSGSATLPTIPRASEISSVSTVDIGSTATITVNRKSTSFTHTITYSFGSLSGTIVNKSSSTSINWTIPTTFYAQIPTLKQGSGYLYITTYSGNTQIGSTSSKLFFVNVNESASKPTVSASVVDTNPTTVNITGNSSIMVAGYSTASVSYTATPRNSAAIKTITVWGYSAYSGTSYSAVSGTKALATFNGSSVNIIATDSRGYSTTKTLSAGTNYTLVNYIPLTFSGTVSRQTPTGSTLLLSFSGKFFNGTLGQTTNTLTITWKYREKGTSTWTDGGTLVRGTDYTINTSNNTYSSGSGSSQSTISLGNIYNYQKSYEIAVYYNDALINTNIILEGKKGQPIFNWNNTTLNVNGSLTIKGTDLFDLLYPVGSYYETSNTNWTPQAAGWKGTWVEDTAGKTTVAKDNSTFATVGSSVGSVTKSYTPAGTVGNHTLTTSEIPSHTHTLRIGSGSEGSSTFTARGVHYFSGGLSWSGGSNTFHIPNLATETGGANYVGYSGGSGAHNHGFTGTQASIDVVQPSIVVRRWHRTA